MKSFIQRLLKDGLYGNTLWMIASTIMLSAFGFLFWNIVARLYSAEAMGIGVTLINTMEIIVALSLFGMNTALVRYLPQSENPPTLIGSVVLLISTISILISIVTLVFVPLLIPELQLMQGDIFLALGFIILVLAYLLFKILDSILVGMRRASKVFIKDALFGISKLALPFLLLALGATGIFISWGLSAGISLLLFIPYLNPDWRHLFDFSQVRELFHFGITNYVATFFGMAPMLVLPLIITRFLSAETTAYFYPAMMLGILLFVVADAMTHPFIAENSHHPKQLKQNIKKAMLFIFPVQIVGVLALFLLGGFLLRLFGEEFNRQGLVMLYLVALSAIPAAVVTLFVAIRNVQKRVYQVMAFKGMQAALIIGLTLAFISQGLIGVGISWIVGQSIIAIAVIGTCIIRRGVL